MSENTKAEEFLQKLAPCIERGDLDACVEEAARVGREMGVGAGELLDLSSEEEIDNRFAYVLALAAVKGIEGKEKAIAYYNAGLAAQSLGKLKNSEEHYKLAIEADPKYTEAHYNYAILLEELNRKDEAEVQYKLAIAADKKHASAHYNYAILLEELNRKDEAEEQYKLAIATDQKHAKAHSNYANLLKKLNRKDEAEEQYLEAIKVNPNNANAHGGYGLLLIELDKRNDAWNETEKASNIFKETGNITQSYLAKAWFYDQYSKKNFNSKKFPQSGEDAGKAGEEYLRAAESAEGSLKDNLTLLGCELTAKSFVRKIPAQSWYKKLLCKLGKNPNLPELIDNLKNAAIWYKKASMCPVDAKKDFCNACHVATSVFSDTLNAMSAFINGEKATINKDDWQSSLDFARKIYAEKKKERGIIFVDTLKQLTECVNELAEHQVIGLKVQEERLGKCYGNLIKVSENLDGALKLLTEHAAEAIKDYAKREGMGFIEETKPKQSFFDNWIVKAGVVLGIIASIILLLQFLKLDSSALDLIKSLISRIGIP